MCQNKIDKHSDIIVGRFDCAEWQGAKTKHGGYGRVVVQLPSVEKKEFRAHRLQYMTSHKIFDIPSHDEHGSKVEISHICHKVDCVNPAHLVLEPHAVNMERLACKNDRVCSKKHTPHCLL